MKNTAKKEHIEHQKALKPLLSHLKADELKLKQKGKKMSKAKKQVHKSNYKAK